MIYLRQSTASQEVLLGPFVDNTDGSTAETGLTINNTDIKIWKWGGTTESDKNSGGATHVAGGRYYTTLDATDTDTVGGLTIGVHVAGALPVLVRCWVMEEAVFDQLFAASAAGYQVPIWSSAGATVNLSATTIKTATDVETDTADIQTRLPAALTGAGNMKADALAISGDTVAADNAEAFFDGTGYAGTNNVIPTVTTVTNAVTLPASATIDITGNITGNLSGSVGSVSGNVGGNVTGSVGSISGVTFPTNFGALAITAGGIVDADLETIKGQTVTCAAGVTVGVYVGGTGAAALEATAQSILTDTAEIGAAGAGLTDAPGNRIANSTTAATNLAALYDALETGTAQAGGASSITLQAGASATTDYYKDQAVFILSGTGADQTNRITAYNGTTKVATVSTAWATQPDNTSVYVVLGRIG